MFIKYQIPISKYHLIFNNFFWPHCQMISPTKYNVNVCLQNISLATSFLGGSGGNQNMLLAILAWWIESKHTTTNLLHHQCLQQFFPNWKWEWNRTCSNLKIPQHILKSQLQRISCAGGSWWFLGKCRRNKIGFETPGKPNFATIRRKKQASTLLKT